MQSCLLIDRCLPDWTLVKWQPFHRDRLNRFRKQTNWTIKHVKTQITFFQSNKFITNTFISTICFAKMSHLQSFVRLGVRSVSRQMQLPKLAFPTASRSLSSLVSKSTFNPAVLNGHRTLATKCKFVHLSGFQTSFRDPTVNFKKEFMPKECLYFKIPFS